MRSAFSLVELSIVLVILGLLTGGILSGQSLIRAAEIRSVSNEYNRWVTAAHTFRDKYFAIPGDMNNATAFWGTAAACPGNNTNTTAPGIPTCNGDGNGQLTTGNATVANETFRFWQHLANAGLIEGTFTGVSNNANSTTVWGSTTTPNIPKSKFPNAQWLVYYLGQQDITSPDYFDGEYGNAFRYGTGNIGTNKVMKPEEAWNIDTKVDDGMPGLGRVRTVKWQAESNVNIACTTPQTTTASSIAASSTYLLSNTGTNCSLIMNTGI